MKNVVVSGSFDNWRAPIVRFLEESSKFGTLDILLWADEDVNSLTGEDPKFPLEERRYFVDSCRYVTGSVSVTDGSLDPDAVPQVAGANPDVWVVSEDDSNAAKEANCKAAGIEYRVLGSDDLQGFPIPDFALDPQDCDTAVVTGCYDWFHSGHIRFFEEASEVAPLYVVIGSDKNVNLLKGEGHPQFKEDERLYMVQSVKFVNRAFVSSGSGWMDAEPEIEKLKPTYYVVNEDGDKPEKSEFCEKHGLEYTVLKRTPKEGLPRRESTHLRGF